MSLFGLKKKTAKVEAPAAAKAVAVAPVFRVPQNYGSMDVSVIIRPHITEKAHSSAEGANVHVFKVKQGATKGMVGIAVKNLYKVTPIKISLVPIPKKSRFVRGRRGFAPGGRKAYIYLKKGDKLELA